jgi:hypothetical protein
VTVICHLYEVKKLSEVLLLSSEVGIVGYIQCTLLKNFSVIHAKQLQTNDIYTIVKNYATTNLIENFLKSRSINNPFCDLVDTVYYYGSKQ